ncbi:MarR family winged helix-turn-helix transcriptional regulator [Candidatus Phycosocius spiralis]|uniref:Transcriptional regulator n=1 Tax=Candidatus Phycosocius spiralis TaxID=2815099 RepID=A0ABQ4PSD6_9PROT|nr:MarR family winged helix-turn-helix transcriptional regulator [Candidatus Phycosocius spiralis]GIU65888.1 transcriptional regulator [Candidatus Phycosocius spiralis]
MAGQTQEISLLEASETSSLGEYRRALSLVERLHRQLLDVVKDDLDRAGHDDLTPVQALLIFNIGDAEWSAGELKSRGFYLGSNVSYNLKKLHELGYVESGKSQHDKRQIRLRLTKLGNTLRNQLDAMFQRHAATLSPVGGVESPELTASNKTLTRLERFWADQIRFRL